MDVKLKRMTANTPCFCGSKLGWKACCGKYSKEEEGFGARIDVTGVVPIRFFLGSLLDNNAYTDDDGTVLVFTNRSQALVLNATLGHKYQIIGMGADKWKLFQRDIPNHMVISDALA
jgi:SEC-C motif